MAISRHPIIAGVDIGDRHSNMCLIDTESGKVLDEAHIATSSSAFERYFSKAERMRVAIEVGTHLPWVNRLLKECGHEVLVANARKLKLIYGEGNKTDSLDAENLARLARLDPKLLSPIEHRGEASQAHLALIRSRDALIRSRIRAFRRELRGRRYLGLVPEKDQSGERDPPRRISNRGDRMLRRLLVGSAHYLLWPVAVEASPLTTAYPGASSGGLSAMP